MSSPTASCAPAAAAADCEFRGGRCLPAWRRGAWTAGASGSLCLTARLSALDSRAGGDSVAARDRCAQWLCQWRRLASDASSVGTVVARSCSCSHRDARGAGLRRRCRRLARASPQTLAALLHLRARERLTPPCLLSAQRRLLACRRCCGSRVRRGRLARRRSGCQCCRPARAALRAHGHASGRLQHADSCRSFGVDAHQRSTSHWPGAVPASAVQCNASAPVYGRAVPPACCGRAPLRLQRA